MTCSGKRGTFAQKFEIELESPQRKENIMCVAHAATNLLFVLESASAVTTPSDICSLQQTSARTQTIYILCVY